MSASEILQELVQSTGAHALWILFGASLMEYVFPPFPGDTVTLLGAYYSVVGVLPIPLVFGAVTSGSVVGSAFNYWVGLKLRGFSEKREAFPFPFRWLSIEKLRNIQESWRRRGDLLILFNRFFPGIRGLFFVAAGMGQIHFRRVMILGAISAAIWNSLLLGLGYLVGANLEELERYLQAYSTIAWTVLALLVLLFVVRALWRRRRSRREGKESSCLP